MDEIIGDESTKRHPEDHSQNRIITTQHMQQVADRPPASGHLVLCTAALTGIPGEYLRLPPNRIGRRISYRSV